MGKNETPSADLDGRVYLDWNATARPDPVALEVWMECVREGWANASSLHAEGQRAAERLREARATLARATGASAGEWVFTSGGTESIHAAIHGALRARPGRRRVVASAGEHACVRAILATLEESGVEVVRAGLDSEGRWDPREVAGLCDASTALATLVWANNETGAVSDVATAAALLAERRVPLHLDAVQVPGRLPLRLDSLAVAMVSISGHKFGAPKGIGALYVRRATPWRAWMEGEQERGRRGGTSNVAGASAMAVALERACGRDASAMARLRDGFERMVLERVPGTLVVSGGAARLPNTSLIVLDGVESAAALLRLDDRGFAVSSGSACTAGRTDPSPVLLAMGLSDAQAHRGLRVSIGPDTRESDLERLAEVLAEEVPRLREGR